MRLPFLELTLRDRTRLDNHRGLFVYGQNSEALSERAAISLKSQIEGSTFAKLRFFKDRYLDLHPAWNLKISLVIAKSFRDILYFFQNIVNADLELRPFIASDISIGDGETYHLYMCLYRERNKKAVKVPGLGDNLLIKFEDFNKELELKVTDLKEFVDSFSQCIQNEFYDVDDYFFYLLAQKVSWVDEQVLRILNQKRQLEELRESCL